MTLSKELVAASTIPLVLSLLDRRDYYGYALSKRIRELSGDRITWSDGMLYPVLRRLESQQLIRSYWRNGETGRRRRYYRIEEAGRQELRRQRDQWDLVSSMFEVLSKEERPCST